MATGEVKIYDGVSVLSWSYHDDALWVDLVGGPSNVCGYVRLDDANGDEPATSQELLTRWEREATNLTYVSRDGVVQLVDVEQMAAWPGPSDNEPSKG